MSLQQQIIATQQETMRQLSTPLIPIANRVILLPLVGNIDQQRAQQVIETVLHGVDMHQASIALIDITGVTTVDTQVAQTIVEAAQAVRLLGARVMLTGIQPQIAQTLVHLGTDLQGIDTRADLQSGIAWALQQQNVKSKRLVFAV
ncbi:MAG: STAS domain-containing protein [Chloroflexaceae bacterium]|nr:STAS domain-containing protein [Chloroflexaceae bacterium]